MIEEPDKHIKTACPLPVPL